jgi:hypothetical protein
MALSTITSITAVLALVIPGVYNQPVVIQGFSTDDMFDMDSFPKVEAKMGLDGHLSQGYVKVARKMKIKLAADSPSGIVFDNWAQAMDTAQDALPCSGTIVIQSNGIQATLNNGALTMYSDIPAAKKTLEPQTYEITWESVVISGM